MVINSLEEDFEDANELFTKTILPRRRRMQKYFAYILVFALSLLLIVPVDTVMNSSKNVINKTYNSQIPKASNGYLTAATYFGNSWPVNFWSSDLTNADHEMKVIKSDGFNSIVLVVPWGEFQTGIFPEKYDYTSFQRLQNLIQIAQQNKLKVILRIGYSWDLNPNDQLPHTERFTELFTNKNVYQAWLDYVSMIYQHIKKYNNVEFGFITWEDLWSVVDEASNLTDLSSRVQLATKTGFTEYVKSHYTLDQVSMLYGQTISSWDELPTPLRKSPAFSIFFSYIDDLLVNKFFIPAQQRFPTLSMEVRVDSDPIFQSDGSIVWQSHSSTYQLPKSKYTTIYYSPSMGADNKGDFESSKTALVMLGSTLNNIETYAGNRSIFIDQFLYSDNTPAFSYNTKISNKDIPGYLTGSSKYLVQYTSGYAVWTYRDYAANAVYNPSFSLGTLGWFVHGGTREGANGNSLAMIQGSTATQYIAKTQDFYYTYNKNETVSFKATSKSATIEVRVGTKFVKKIVVSPHFDNYQFTVPMSELKNLNISFTCISGSFTLSDVKIYSFVQSAGVRSQNLEPEKYLSAIQKLNYLLQTNSPSYNQVFDANANWSISQESSQNVLQGSYPIEGATNNKYVWIGYNARMFMTYDSKMKGIRIKGYIPFDLLLKANPSMSTFFVNFSVNGVPVLSQSFNKTESFDVTIPVSSITSIIRPGQYFRLDITPTNTFVPKNISSSSDQRLLAIILNYVGVVR